MSGRAVLHTVCRSVANNARQSKGAGADVLAVLLQFREESALESAATRPRSQVMGGADGGADGMLLLSTPGPITS